CLTALGAFTPRRWREAFLQLHRDFFCVSKLLGQRLVEGPRAGDGLSELKGGMKPAQLVCQFRVPGTQRLEVCASVARPQPVREDIEGILQSVCRVGFGAGHESGSLERLHFMHTDLPSRLSRVSRARNSSPIPP